MLSDTFIKTSRIVFEPVFYIMAAGMVLALLNPPYRKRFFLPLALALVFMFSWRCCITMLSARYAAIFIYAGVGFSAYAAYRLTPFLTAAFFHPANRCFRFLHRHMRLAGRILLLAIILICIGKFLRYNRYDGCIPESVALVKADSEQMEEARFFDFCGEAARLQFYLGLPVETWKEAERKFTTPDEIRKRLAGSVCANVFCNEPPGHFFSPQDMKMTPQQWSRLYSSPEDNRKKIYFSVYRYRQNPQEIQE